MRRLASTLVEQAGGALEADALQREVGPPDVFVGDGIERVGPHVVHSDLARHRHDELLAAVEAHGTSSGEPAAAAALVAPPVLLAQPESPPANSRWCDIGHQRIARGTPEALANPVGKACAGHDRR